MLVTVYVGMKTLPKSMVYAYHLIFQRLYFMVRFLVLSAIDQQ